jgi:NADP-dependent 3-hydroxy acid dehydrogenase YdfG
MPPPKPKTILITGCSANSIGASLALTLAKKGHHIFATARSPAKIPSPLTTLSNVTLLQLDVTSPTSIIAAVKAVQDHGLGLDVLVNNAGVGYTAPLLDADIDYAKSVYETNVWGVLRMIQGFADLLIANRGRVVNLSSVGAVVNTPWIGISFSPTSIYIYIQYANANADCIALLVLYFFSGVIVNC